MFAGLALFSVMARRSRAAAVSLAAQDHDREQLLQRLEFKLLVFLGFVYQLSKRIDDYFIRFMLPVESRKQL